MHNVEVFLGNFSSSDTSTAQAENMRKGVRCAAHTLQLAVEDPLKKLLYAMLLIRLDASAKKLRNPSVFVLLKKLKLRKPVLDCLTRWHSTYDMLQRLLLVKDFYLDMAASNPNLHLPETSWNAFSMFVEVLEPAKIATKSLQCEQLTFGDFFGIWLNCKLKIAKLTSTSYPTCTVAVISNGKKRDRIVKK